jgi:hypothetical protein
MQTRQRSQWICGVFRRCSSDALEHNTEGSNTIIMQTQVECGTVMQTGHAVCKEFSQINWIESQASHGVGNQEQGGGGINQKFQCWGLHLSH